MSPTTGTAVPAGAAESGAAGLWSVTVAAVLLAVTAGVLTWSGALVARQRAQTAADLAALAAAGALVRGGDPCAAAHRVVLASGSRLAGCVADGGTAVTVVVERPVPVARLRGLDVPPARARARAGLPP